jgi:hypothetical protein
VHSTPCRYGRSIVAPYFSFIRKGRCIRPEDTALNVIDKGKSFSLCALDIVVFKISYMSFREDLF